MSDYENKVTRAKRPLSDVMDNATIKNISYQPQGDLLQPRSGAGPVDMVGDAAREARGNGALKYDQEKEPLSLLSRTWLLGVATVMGFGARKYAAHNWRNGLSRSRLISAAIRHILAYNEGEDKDPETGLSHLDHASCCLMFARESHETQPGLDDRWKHPINSREPNKEPK